MSEQNSRIYLSPPHIGDLEQNFVADAFASNWIAPLGPHVDAFEREFATVTGAQHAVALSSGTAALHLAMQLVGVERGSKVLVSTLTFAGSVNPVIYLGGVPIFVDSERTSWNMDPALLEAELRHHAKAGDLPKAVVLVHLYGQSADTKKFSEICERYGIALIEDAAEALGTTYKGSHVGKYGRLAAYSFNGNKIITTSGGGMLTSDDGDLIAAARKLATQARDPFIHYEHSQIGYNYRLSNVLAAIGRGQLRVLNERVDARRRNFAYYAEALSDIPGIEFMPEAPWGRHTRWLTTLTIDAAEFGATPDEIRLSLERENIEARPVWKPMHMQPVFAGCRAVGGAVAEDLFERGLCLPSGSSLTEADLERVVACIRAVHSRARTHTVAL